MGTKENNLAITLIESTTAKKRFVLEDGKIKTGGQYVSKGKCITASLDGLEDLKELIETDNFTLIHGTLENNTDEYKVGTKDDISIGATEYARTKDFFSYRNEYSVVMLDLDDGKAEEWQGLDHMVQDLRNTFPWLKDVGLLAVPSSSNGWYYLEDNAPLKRNGVCKWHVYLIIKSELVNDFKDIMIDKAWFDGKGFIDLSASGAMLVRQNFDGAVFSPERLDYTQTAEDTTGLLYKNAPETRIYNGERLDTLPVNKWRKAAHEAIQAAKDAIKPDAIKCKFNYYTQKGLTTQEIDSKIKYFESNGFDSDLVYPTQLIHTKHGEMKAVEYFDKHAMNDLSDGGYLPDPITGEAMKAYLFGDSESPFQYSIRSFKNEMSYYFRNEEVKHTEVINLGEKYMGQVMKDINDLSGLVYINAGCGTGKTHSFSVQYANVWLVSPLKIISSQNTAKAHFHAKKHEEDPTRVKNLLSIVDNEINVNEVNNIAVYDQLKDVSENIAQGKHLKYQDITLVIDEAHSIFLDGYRNKAMRYLETVINSNVFKAVVLISGTSRPQDFGFAFDKEIYFKKRTTYKTFQTTWHAPRSTAKVYTLLSNIIGNLDAYDGISVLHNNIQDLQAVKKVLDHCGVDNLLVYADANNPEVNKFKQDGLLKGKVVLGTSSIVEGININNKLDKVLCLVMGEFNTERLEQFANRWRKVKEINLMQFKSMDYKPENPFNISDSMQAADVYKTTKSVSDYIDKIEKRLTFISNDDIFPRNEVISQMHAYNFCEAFDIDPLTLSFSRKPFIVQRVWSSLRLADERKQYIAQDKMKAYGFTASNYIEYKAQDAIDYVEKCIETANNEMLADQWLQLKSYEATGLTETKKYIEDVETKLVSCGLKLPPIPDVYDSDAAIFVEDFNEQLKNFFEEKQRETKLKHYQTLFNGLLTGQAQYNESDVVLLVETFEALVKQNGLIFPHKFTPTTRSATRVLREYFEVKRKKIGTRESRKNVFEITAKPFNGSGFKFDL